MTRHDAASDPRRHNWRAVRLVARREVRDRLSSKGFLISSVATLAVLAGVIVVPQLLGGDDVETYTVGVVGRTPDGFEDTLDQVAAGRQALVDVVPVADRRAAESGLEDDDLDAVLLDGRAVLVDERDADAVAGLVEAAVAQVGVLDRLTDRGLSPAEAAAALTPQPLEVENLAGEDGDGALPLAFFGVVLLFLMVTINAGMLLNGTIEEKSSRVVEVLLGALRPWHLLAGKLLGLGGLAVAQFAVYGLVAYVAATASGAWEPPPAAGGAIATALAWFLLGFAFYASVYAAAGAMASSVEDAQASAGPLGFLLVAAYLVAITVVVPNPESVASRVLSQAPPLSPMAVPARIALDAITAWEVALAAVLMVVSTYGVVRLAGRLYAAALLSAGGRLTWRGAWSRRREAITS